MTLDLSTPRGQEIARGLAERADVLVENFMPGTMAKNGLGYEALAELNPRLVYVSSTGFGQTGPNADRKGYDTVFQALSGIMSLTGHPGSPPAKVGVPISDMTSGLWIVIAVLTGLLGRDAQGRGGHVDLAMMDVQTSLLALAGARIFALGEDPSRTGTEHLGRVPSAAFECADEGWLHISGSDQHWGPLCTVLDLPELAADPDLATNAGRLAQRERVSAALRDAVARWPRDELADALRAVDVPAGEVKSAREALADPHTMARRMVGRFDHPVEGEFSALRTPLRQEDGEYPEPGVPPLLGADTEDVLTGLLGLAEADVARLREEGTI